MNADIDGEIITATEASRSFSDMLHRVCYGGESFIIKKGNRLMARLTPVDAIALKGEKTALESENQIPEGETSSAIEYFKAMIEEINKEPVG